MLGCIQIFAEEGVKWNEVEVVRSQMQTWRKPVVIEVSRQTGVAYEDRVSHQTVTTRTKRCFEFPCANR